MANDTVPRGCERPVSLHGATIPCRQCPTCRSYQESPNASREAGAGEVETDIEALADAIRASMSADDRQTSEEWNAGIDALRELKRLAALALRPPAGVRETAQEDDEWDLSPETVLHHVMELERAADYVTD